MTTILSILRGINVSGQKKIKMTDLKSMYESLGFKNVTTYIQSGNVVFDCKSADGLVEQIEKAILKTFAFEVPVIIRTKKEIQSIVKNNPFLKKSNIEVDKLHITYLSEVPTTENLSAIQVLDFEPDLFTVKNKEVYVYCPNGYGKTKLTNTFFEKKLKEKATTRNWKTCNQLLYILENN